VNQEALIRRIKERARQDRAKRRDRRFLETMGFLVSKGFLGTNFAVPLSPNKRVRVDDAIWAGKNVEPRILEVLPAAVLRLRRHFDLDPETHGDLVRVVEQLRRREEQGDAYCGMPYEKIKLWAELPLRDKRVKPVTRKKISKTFRLDPMALDRLRKAAEEKGCTETEVIEALLLRRSPT
jgi:hypothetical protein